ncbi:MAG: DUF4271 domain-containing protein [Alistipes putredinis]|nr:MAG: DUF4271 domain-containing protein [Alistipes putredinis]
MVHSIVQTIAYAEITSSAATSAFGTGAWALLQVMSVAILFAYAIMCHYFRAALSVLMRELKSGGQSAGDAAGKDYAQLLNLTGAIGMLSLTVFLSKAFTRAYAEEISAAFPAWFAPLTCVAVLLILAAIVLYQKAVLHSAGFLTLSGEFVRMLLHLKRVCFALLAIAVSPTLLLYSSMRGTADSVFLYISGIETILILLLFLYKSRKLFAEQKISILYWFLYLCIVELFPISLTVSILLRII